MQTCCRTVASSELLCTIQDKWLLTKTQSTVCWQASPVSEFLTGPAFTEFLNRRKSNSECLLQLTKNRFLKCKCYKINVIKRLKNYGQVWIKSTNSSVLRLCFQHLLTCSVYLEEVRQLIPRRKKVIKIHQMVCQGRDPR